MFVADPNSLLSSSEMVPGDLAGHRLRPPGAIHLWQGGSQHAQPRPASFEQSGLSSDGVGGGATISCQDCGNQAKKDCSHRRCRTCCKSRGFDCRTHVKSTWVPASRRRERQAMAAAAAAGASSGSTSGSKKPRLIDTTTTNSHTSTSNTPPGSLDTTSSHQEAGFKGSLPGQVREKAVFKCVRVTAVEDGKDEFAYQAAVTIGGHVFKGFLYDQGPLSGDCQLPNVSDLHLGGGSGGGGVGGAARNGGSSSTPLLDPSDVVYGGGSGGGFLGGSSYDQLTVLQPPSSREA